ncbi:LamG domain-containing protein [Giesbergeria anulus]|uniref:Concanavalin A-like lectin/glucanases superfamily protein n=1 Tax=Giesbergeria anulus TaxID=180197 RepID=A0A1H9E3K1_9BURK|nr:LamG domain-containing protein [Giesbergeria anulus]SEQ20152.1 hypothetical protein SAMN02982919_00190 [Giesbergeria anulus]
MSGLARRLMSCIPADVTDIAADAVDFDGTNDYLSRGSDLVGNADGKTFTFSAWVWVNAGVTGVIGANSGGAARFGIYTDGSGLYIQFTDGTGADVLNAYISGPGSSVASKTFLHVLASMDVSNTSKRAVYVNDVPAAVTWTTYLNQNLKFTHTTQYIAMSSTVGSPKTKGRLSQLFLDCTYRDISVEANRRLFITADRKPALNQQSLNPILYLPLNDPTQPGLNLGTGGNFNLTGTVACSGRGPSQFNAPYSDLDGAADYLSRATALSGVANSKNITVSAIVNPDAVSGEFYILNENDTTREFSFGYRDTGGGGHGIQLFVLFKAGANGFIQTKGASLVAGRNYIFTVSVDASDNTKTRVFINGLSVAYNLLAPIANTNVVLTGAQWKLGKSYGASWIDGKLGNVFFDTKYIDLSQPANLAKFVAGTGVDAKPVDLGANGEKPFGIPPLIYLPMYGNNAGKNYGSGGDFTVNSGPFAGARGPNEFWGNKADFDGSTGYLSRASALAGVSDGKMFSCSFNVTQDVESAAQDNVLAISNASGGGVAVMVSSSALWFFAKSVIGGTVLWTQVTSPAFIAGTSYSVQACFDLANSANRHVCVNGSLATVTYAYYTNSAIALSGATQRIGVNSSGSPVDFLDGKLSELYFTTDYIDFSQEANRLKFRDAFGNPVDLAPQIKAGTLPNPAIYLRFDPANFGKNYGTGGDFTASGTITDGGQL